jgi:hypothetical protein
VSEYNSTGSDAWPGRCRQRLRTLKISFLEPGAEAYAFTFG